MLLPLTLLLLSTAAQAGSTITTCELIDTGMPRTFVCSTSGDGADLTSQTWSLTTGGTLISQATGIMAAECGGSTNIGYQFIAALSDGMTDTGSGSLPCQDGDGGDQPPIVICDPFDRTNCQLPQFNSPSGM
ncbi:MAG: hypothetical protein KKC01_03945 [Gammaproteobacteria bacterium]|nr:hypothetical protein [Gammaproteobacteria bacterium]